MMKILITGGAGCLGSNIIEHYIPKGYKICVIDNFATGKKELVSGLDNLTLYEGSIFNKDLVEDVFKEFKPNYVIHSAASYKDPENFIEDINTNIQGTVNVANAVKKVSSVEKFINFQTALCYGIPKKIPIPIDHSLNPITSYGITKTSGEQFLMMMDFPVISLRLANICGPRLSIGPIPTFYTRLKEGKDCFCSDSYRDFLDMSDFLNLIDIILNNNKIVNGIFNVSTGEGHSIKEIFDIVANYLKLNIDKEPPIIPVGDDDIKTVVLDPKTTEELFSWKAKVDFKDIIINQLNWYDEYGVSDIFSHLKNS